MWVSRDGEAPAGEVDCEQLRKRQELALVCGCGKPPDCGSTRSQRSRRGRTTTTKEHAVTTSIEAMLRAAAAHDLAEAEAYLTPEVTQRIIDRVLRKEEKKVPLDVAAFNSSI